MQGDDGRRLVVVVVVGEREGVVRRMVDWNRLVIVEEMLLLPWREREREEKG